MAKFATKFDNLTKEIIKELEKKLNTSMTKKFNDDRMCIEAMADCRGGLIRLTCSHYGIFACVELYAHKSVYEPLNQKIKEKVSKKYPFFNITTDNLSDQLDPKAIVSTLIKTGQYYYKLINNSYKAGLRIKKHTKEEVQKIIASVHNM